MSTDLRLLRSWAAELSATEQLIRTSLAQVFAAGAVRRVEADAVAVADDLLTRAGFDPDDATFLTGYWAPPALPAGVERRDEDHTDELLTAAIATQAARLEGDELPFADEAALEPLDDLDLDLHAAEPADGWITYDEPAAEEEPTAAVAPPLADAWVQYEDEQPTNPGIGTGPLPVVLGAHATAPPPLAAPPPPTYMTHDDDGDVLVHEADENDATAGIFDRHAAAVSGAGHATGIDPSPATVPEERPGPAQFQTDAESMVAFDLDTVDTLDDEHANPTPVPERASRVSAPPIRPLEARSRAAQGVDEFDLVGDGPEPAGPLPDDEVDQASDAEVVRSAHLPGSTPPSSAQTPARAAAVSAVAATPRVAKGGVRGPPEAAARATAGLYGSAAVPTIRDSQAPRPKAAAIQINAQSGSSKVLGLEEEEEPLEIGSAEDYGEEEPDEPSSGGGFRINLHEYEEVEVEPDPSIEGSEGAGPLQAAAPVPLTGPTAAEIQAMLSRARAAEEGGQLDDGIALYADVLDADPDNIDARVGRGRLYLDRGDFARAMSDFMVAEEIGPQHPEPQIAIGDLHFARKDYRKAIDYFDLALSLAPKSAMAYCRRGISHYWRKAYPQALADLATAQKIDPETPHIGTYITMVKKKMKK